jgi:hypothetical protein
LRVFLLGPLHDTHFRKDYRDVHPNVRSSRDNVASSARMAMQP